MGREVRSGRAASHVAAGVLTRRSAFMRHTDQTPDATKLRNALHQILYQGNLRWSG